MNKKIFVIAIISMFLITSFSTLSVGKEINQYLTQKEDIDPISALIQKPEDQKIDLDSRNWIFGFICGELEINSMSYDRIGKTNLYKNVVIKGDAIHPLDDPDQFCVGKFIYWVFFNDLTLNVKLLINPPFDLEDVQAGEIVNFGEIVDNWFAGTFGFRIRVEQ